MNKLYIVSYGPGGVDYITQEAQKALCESEVVVSYTKYAKEIYGLIKDKILYTSGMTKEIDRANKAIEYALQGKVTAIISNGDVNVFGMATLIIEIIDKKKLWDKIEVISIPGVTSFLAAASKIGAPISQDFAIISLSDKLTNINLIDKRIKNALEGDFIIGIYNPKSQTRIEPYNNLLKRLANYGNKLIVIASNIGRENEQISITTSSKLIQAGVNNELISMSTLLIIGNSTTRLTNNKFILTPRGYLNKYDLQGQIIF